MKKTQQQIDEIADAFYDGMASVTDRIEEINKVDETNAYIKKRFGVLPSDSELIIEGTIEETEPIPAETYIIKWLAVFFGLVFMLMALLMTDNIIFATVGICISTVFTCTFFIMSHIEKFGR